GRARIAVVVGTDIHEHAVAAILEEVPDDPFLGELRIAGRTVSCREVPRAARQGVGIFPRRPCEVLREKRAAASNEHAQNENQDVSHLAHGSQSIPREATWPCRLTPAGRPYNLSSRHPCR